ncbi:MAG: FtsW/RodA/SpoVE family cell cycle protein [Candidatus Cloacimonetes bacterium]|nr:FtsW/RodA/SpoVE family cell cycle protein [Candidatus Cloacimonadota bacterium]
MKRTKTQYYVSGYDQWIFISYLVLSVIGLLVLLDISSFFKSLGYFYRQLFYFGASLFIVMFIVYLIDIKKLGVLIHVLMGVSIILLLAVLKWGKVVNGAKRQLDIGFFSFQPSFISRVALIFFYAHVLAKYQDELKDSKIVEFISRFPWLIILTGLTYILIILEKHLSTLIISAGTLLCMLFYAGIRKRILLLVIILGLLAGYLIIKKGDDYRGDRIKLFQKHSLFYRDKNVQISSDKEYQVTESLTALSRGGVFGTGISRGRAKHFFLPEAHTDYIYSIIGEEFGFFGGFVVLALHGLLFFQILRISQAQDNLYLRFLVAGLGLNIFLNVLVNTGVAMSIIPSTGTTLPFVSYSGTAMLVDSASVGVVLSVSAKRKIV